MNTKLGTRPLYDLARLYGVQTAYYDVDRRRQPASVESLLAVLGSLGASVARVDDAPAAIREYKQNYWRRPLDPIIVNWEGVYTSTEIRLPENMSDVTMIGRVELEYGERERWEWHGRRLRTLKVENVEGRKYVVKELPLRGVLPSGYHSLKVDKPGGSAETLIISAPQKAYSPGIEWDSKTWGVFLPLYSLHSDRSWGSGCFSDIELMIEWITKTGGGVVATLPLLASFLDEPFEPSPYAPASRLLWNEFYVDVNRAPEIENCAPAQGMLMSSEFQEEITALRDAPLVDYRRQMALRRNVLEQMLNHCLNKSPRRLNAFEKFVRDNPVVEDYARFRAVSEKQRKPWSQWPDSLRHGVVHEEDYDQKSSQYHMYAQWLAHEQMDNLSRLANRKGSGLYIDLPLGVHPDGYDVWRNQDLFSSGTRVGAPPDTFFTLGQDWGFPPIHPEKMREQGYRYFIDVIQHHLSHAGILRIDHVMGLHRLYWIPEGHDARNGAYVRYHNDELYAILALESHRQHCWIVGENLGTVPSYVNSAMSRHGLGRMYVAQFETNADSKKAMNRVPTNTVASFNTHDLPTFASFWHGADIEGRHGMGLIDRNEADEQQANLDNLKKALIAFLRQKGYLKGEAAPRAVHAACAARLGASQSHLVLVNLEDLWQETQPQNIPGTGQELPNWRRKARYALEEFIKLPEVVDVLREIDRLRKL